MPVADGKRTRLFVVLCVAAIGVGLAVLFSRAPLGKLDAYRATIISAIWIYLPLPFILFSKKKHPDDYGIAWGTGLRGLAETIAFAVAVMIPFYVAFFFIAPAKWSISQAVPKDIPYLLSIQFIAVALPEEFFFRGFVQTELEGFAEKKVRILGADLGWGWIATSLVFTLGHVIVLATPIRAAVFFPALLFGWARSRTKSVLHPAFMHAIFNTTFIVAQKMAGY